jgi:N12 class adenine-specific DNA methylase
VYQDFLTHLLNPTGIEQRNIEVTYSEYTGAWNISGKNFGRRNILAHTTYGSDRANAYKIIEDTLNLKDMRIFDYEYDNRGNKKPILNVKETVIVQGKQDLISREFEKWIWEDPSRRETLTQIYNDKFNAIRGREYNGNHLSLPGMNPSVELFEHQKNAIARILYGGNTLLAHVVGAGKTFEMVAAAMESKRIGLCNKSMMVVPGHLTEQWATEFLQLYPAANILVATKRDFEAKNRKKFCSRIATGDYDAVIIGQTQLEKIPLSLERQKKYFEDEIHDITLGIAQLKEAHG